MPENKSSRNKTIDFSEAEGQKYLERCFFPAENKTLASEEILDKTLCGDSFKILENMPRNFAELIIADPPYNLEKTYNSTKFKEQTSKEYSEYTKNWVERCLPILKSNGTMYICCDWKSSITIADVLCALEDEKKLVIQNRITWEREKGRGAKANWKNCHEDIWFVTKSNEYTFNLDAVKMRRKVIAPYKQDGKPKDWSESEQGNFRDTCPSNFWSDISIPFWSMAENTAHPTQKAEKLLAKLILASSNAGDTVFDPFCGSGSTSVTAKKLGRHWCGIEKEKRYCEFTEYRLEMANENKNIQGYKDGIFYERNTAPND